MKFFLSANLGCQLRLGTLSLLSDGVGAGAAVTLDLPFAAGREQV